MDNSVLEIIASMIGTIGFPIVCCIFLWKYINTTMKEFTNTMNENTKMLTKICDRLELEKEIEKKE